VITKLQTRPRRLAKAVSLLCVFLVLLVSGVQATHVHPDTVKHDCSLCLVAQAGAIVTSSYHTTPVLLPSRIEVATETQVGSRLVSSSLYIRPPPFV
jgi:hypothetical protein